VSKIALIGGGGVRAPLLAYGLNQAHAAIGAGELAIFDADAERAKLMGRLCAAVVKLHGGALRVRVTSDLRDAVEDSSFVLNSIRVGGIAARARDERIALEQGYPGQETTGPGGLAMALRTIPVILEQARAVERYSSQAWFINFSNPAGLITQALMGETSVRVVGICDTPTELFHRIGIALGAPDAECDYFGLNHLGWVRRVQSCGRDVTERLLNSDSLLRSLYSTDLFDPALIRTLGLIPTEYLFFYYAKRKALENQRAAGATRGEEIARLNQTLFSELAHDLDSSRPERAVATYVRYLNQRSGSYMKLETEGGSAFVNNSGLDDDPFESATGYHRIALDVMQGLSVATPRRIVVNVRNEGTIEDLQADDVVEVPCLVSRTGIVPQAVGSMPDSVRGLVLAVKAYEKAAIRAAVESSMELAQLALLLYPAVGEWEPGTELLRALIQNDPEHLGYLRKPVPVS
jgi:6-phospho-beta-glucosidase